MNKIQQQQNKLSNELFYLPQNKYPQQNYSQNFIKLFKNALSKVYYKKDTFNNSQHSSIRKHSQLRSRSSQKSLSPSQSNKKMTISYDKQQGKQSQRQRLTQRQKLIRQILNSKNQITSSRKKDFISKRCKTLQHKQKSNSLQQSCLLYNDNSSLANSSQNNQNYSTLDSSNKNSSRYKVPIKIKHAYSMNRQRKNQSHSLPPIMQKLSNNKKLSQNSQRVIFQNLQIIHKYRQLQAQYRSKQFLSTPIQIFSVWTPSFKLNSKEAKLHHINKLTKDTMIRSKTKKIKYALDDISRYNKHQNSQHTGSSNLDYMMQQQQVLKQIWKEKQKKLIQIQTSNFSNNILLKNNKKKLKPKQPLDQYFKPWQNPQETKHQSQFHSYDPFHNTKQSIKYIIKAQQNTSY